jgi:hypothetical protein
VHDIVPLTLQRLAVATDLGVAVQPAGRSLYRWRFLPSFPNPQAKDPSARSGDRLAPRLFTDGAGDLAARQRGYLWRWDEALGEWVAYGPAELAGRLASVAGCCGEGALALPDGKSWLWAGTEGVGLWLSDDGGVSTGARAGWPVAASPACLPTRRGRAGCWPPATPVCS